MNFQYKFFFRCHLLALLLWSIYQPVTNATSSMPATLNIRAIQTRDFSNISFENAYRAGLTTFQDLGFIITETSKDLGLIKANQIHLDRSQIILATLTITQNPTQTQQITARLSLSLSPFLAGEEGVHLAGGQPKPVEMIKTPITYQQFFDALSYAIQFQQ